jgi:hypothetical protein
MARRSVSPEKRDYRSNSHTKGSYKRKENIRDQKLVIIIACEGEKTEQFYFHAFFRELQKDGTLSNASCIIAPHNHTDPCGVLDDLLFYKDKRTGKTYKDFTHKWIVIDRDEERTNGGGHTRENFHTALSRVKSNKPEIKVAYSNPSFEIWILLHYEYRVASVDRNEVIVQVKKYIPDYEKNLESLYLTLRENRHNAIARARRLHNEACDNSISPADENPGSTVFELLEELLNP